jgi:hypothetical protein
MAGVVTSGGLEGMESTVACTLVFWQPANTTIFTSFGGVPFNESDTAPALSEATVDVIGRAATVGVS